MILDDMKRNKEIKKWEPQFTLRLDVEGIHIANYIADFLVTTIHGAQEIHETKGYFTPIGKLKWKLAKVLYKEYKFVLIR